MKLQKFQMSGLFFSALFDTTRAIYKNHFFLAEVFDGLLKEDFFFD